MYLEHFSLQSDPFTLTPDTALYCQLPSHDEAFDTILFALQQGNSTILVSGEVGTGKTLLCRKLLHALDDNHFVTTFIPNPLVSVDQLLIAFAHELNIKLKKSDDVYEKISQKLIDSAQQGLSTVLIIDEAQVMSNEGLEAIRLLTNLETEKQKLLQIVLFAQPELLSRLKKPELRQLTQRIMHIANTI